MNRINKTFLYLFKMLLVFSCILMILFLNTGCQTDEQIKQVIESKVYYEWWYDLKSDFSEISIQNIDLFDNKTSGSTTFVASASGKFFDVSTTIKLYFYKKGNQWVLNGEPQYGHSEFTFHQNNDEFYYFGGRNTSELFQIKHMDQESVIVDIYGYDSGGYGEWYSSTENWEISYINHLQYFEFPYHGATFRGATKYRVYPNRIERSYEDVNLAYNVRDTKYSEISPQNPNEYWWFRKRWQT